VAVFREADIVARERTAKAQPNTPLGRRAAQEAAAMRNANATQARQKAPAPPAAQDPSGQNSATAAVQAQLDAYGLGTLAPSVWRQWLDGVPVEQIVAGLRDTSEYKARFPGLDKMRKEGRGITERDWVNYEQTVRGIYRANGLPEAFYDSPSDFAELIDKGVDARELETRIGAAQDIVVRLPQSVRDAAVAEGINLGDLTALWIDPDVAVPAIEKKVRQLTVQGAAMDSGWGAVGADEANALAARGMDYGQAKAAFDQATALTPLATRQLGDTTDLDRSDISGAVVGNNAGAKRKVQKRAESRAAQGVSGGGYAGSAGGVAGLGSASR
jgi:hypothetical protein